VSRKVVGVGALGPNEGRTVTVSVDVFTGAGPTPEAERRESATPRPLPGKDKKELPEPQRSLQNLSKGPTKPLK
jgi:hypothetical protein